MALSKQKKQHVKRLSKKGVIVSKSAAERLNKKRANRILSMKHRPMYVNEQFIEWMQEKNPDVSYTEIEANRNLPAFTGVDGKVYYLTHGEEHEIPRANADLLVNRGQAERTTRQ